MYDVSSHGFIFKILVCFVTLPECQRFRKILFLKYVSSLFSGTIFAEIFGEEIYFHVRGSSFSLFFALWNIRSKNHATMLSKKRTVVSFLKCCFPISWRTKATYNALFCEIKIEWCIIFCMLTYWNCFYTCLKSVS